jgi:uncharacterized hydrophobic protein (TIGR00341 family)
VFRLIGLVVPKERETAVKQILKNFEVLDFDVFSYESITRFNVIVRAENTEELLDILEKNLGSTEGFKISLTPINAYFPRPEEEKKPTLFSITDLRKQRVTRDEIYDTVLEMTTLNSVFLLLVILASLVAAVGILNNNVPIIIASMIMTPLIGPGIGLSYGLVMGDRNLAFLALKTLFVGVVIGFVIAFFLGVFLPIDPAIPAIVTRTDVGRGGFVVALASGFAGALAVSSKKSSALVGVMISIALIPPLVASGLLIGSANYLLGWSALLLFLVNVVTIYVASLLTFYVEGLRPVDPEKAKAAKTMARAGFLILFIALIVLFAVNVYQGEIWASYAKYLAF